MIWEKEMATHFGNLAWKIPWAEEPGGLKSMVSQRVGHDWVTKQQQPEVRIVDTFDGGQWLEGHAKSVPGLLEMCCFLILVLVTLEYWVDKNSLSYVFRICALHMYTLSFSEKFIRKRSMLIFLRCYGPRLGFTGGSDGKTSACNAGDLES